MKIATYNLRFGGKAGQRDHWAKLFEAANPDIFLVQETCRPQEYDLSPGFWTAYHQQVKWSQVGNNPWGSAVFVRSGLVKQLDVPAEFAGSVVCVEVEEFTWSPVQQYKLRIFNIHAPSPYKSSVNRILDWVASLVSDCDLVIGGDFNLTVSVRHSKEDRKDGDKWLLDRLRKEFGLIGCWQAANPNCDLPQTLRWGKDKSTPYHCDGIFVPCAWYQYLEGCEVLDTGIWQELSDHNPVIATFSR